MRELTVAEAAVAGGTTQETVERFIELGIVLPLNGGVLKPSDVRRVRLVLALTTSGVPAESIADAIHDGRISFDFIDELAPEPIPLLPETEPELVERVGISSELARTIATILGTCALPPGEQVRADHAELYELAAASSDQGASDEHMARVLRATVDSMRRVVEAQRDFIEELLFQPLAEAGSRPSEILTATAAQRRRYREVGARTIQLLYARLVDEATFQQIVETMEEELEQHRLAGPGAFPAIAFMDISGYTKLAEEAGDEEAARLAGKFTEAVEAIASGFDGRLVKVLGDGVMMHFRDASTAVRGAMSLMRRVGTGTLPPARVGIHSGPMVRRDGDYFGSVVNLASRAAEYASPLEILVTQEVVNAWSGGNDVYFKGIGAVGLKNVKRRIELFQVLPADDMS